MNLEEQKIKILHNVLGDYSVTKGSHGNEYLFRCSKCNHFKKKLSINIQKGKFKCWVCLWSGRISSLIPHSSLELWKSYDDTYDHSFLAEQEENKLEPLKKLPEEFVSLSEQKNYLTQPKEYLFKRGLSKRDILRWKIGCCLEGEYRNRIIIPSFDLNGNLNYFVSRSYTGDSYKYKNPAWSKDIIFNELFLDWDRDVILTEGVFDAMMAENSVILLGSSLKEDSHIFQSILKNTKKIYSALDPDAKEKEIDILKKIMSYGIEIYKVNIHPHKDVNDMGKEEFLKRKNQAVLLNSFSDIQYLLEF